MMAETNAETLPVVAVAGAFRSGTNYLRYLIEANFQARVDFDHFGWKHVPIADGVSDGGQVPLISVMKDPFAFCCSLYRYFASNHRNIRAAEDWDGFLRGPLIIFNGKRRGKSVELKFASPISYWNELNWNLSYLPKRQFRSRCVRYEDLISNPTATVSELASWAEIGELQGPLSYPDLTVRRGGPGKDPIEHVEQGHPFDKGYYLERRYMAEYSQEQRLFVSRSLDRELADLLRYPVDGKLDGAGRAPVSYEAMNVRSA